MTIKTSIINEQNKPVLQVLVLFLIGFFLIMTFLAAFVLIPRINQSFEKQHLQDSEITLEIEVELFKRFVENYRTILQDLANFPVITSTVLLSQPDNSDFIDLVDNFSISGEKSRLVLQDIAGEVLYQTAQNIKGDFSTNAPWIKPLLNGDESFNFQLLEQEGEVFRFVLSVPVMYHNNIEGILSAEITTPLSDIFSPKTIEEGSAFTLRQGDVTVKMDVSSMALPRKIKTYLAVKDIELTYINDYTKVIVEQNKLRNMTLIVLFFGLAISFIFFSVLAYRMLMGTEEDKTFHKNIFSKSYTIPLIIGSIGIAASILAYFLIQNLKHQQIQQETLAANNLVIQSIEETLISKASTLNSLKAFFDASQHIDRIEFKTFTAPFFKEHQDIHALEWVPKIEGLQREHYEKLARADGLAQYTIKEANAQGILEPAPLRDVYFPVYYAEPQDVNKKILGLDSPFNLRRVEAIKQATDTGDITAAGTFPLLQDEQKKTGMLIFNPVYSDALNYIDAQQRQEHLKGFVLLVLRIDDVINPTLNKQERETLISLEDVTAPQKPELIFGSYDQNSINVDLISDNTIEIFGRRWKIKAFPSSNPYQNITSFLPWLVLVGGIIFTVFITYTFIQLIRRREIIEGIVNARTKEVKELSSAMENAVEGVSQIDYKGSYIYLNESYASTCGYNSKQLVGENWRKTIHPDDHEMMHDAYMAMFDHGQVTVEPRGVRKNGTIFYKRITMIARYANNGEFIGHHCFMSDISDRKKAEEEILNSNSELEEFAYRTSHDLRSPIISSVRLLSMAEQAIHDKNNDIALMSLSHAQTSLQKLDTLIKDILALTETKNKEEEPKNINIDVLVNDALEKMEHMEGFERLDIQTEFQFKDNFCAKETRFNMILENLISNAIKYQDPKKENPYIKISTKNTNGVFIFEVKDNGLGVPKDQQDKLFTMFKRFHPKVAFGSGLGLYLMKKSADVLNGEISFHDHGDGSTFRLSIPL